jgi:hypothetical protein
MPETKIIIEAQDEKEAEEIAKEWLEKLYGEGNVKEEK